MCRLLCRVVLLVTHIYSVHQHLLWFKTYLLYSPVQCNFIFLRFLFCWVQYIFDLVQKTIAFPNQNRQHFDPGLSLVISRCPWYSEKKFSAHDWWRYWYFLDRFHFFSIPTIYCCLVKWLTVIAFKPTFRSENLNIFQIVFWAML